MRRRSRFFQLYRVRFYRDNDVRGVRYRAAARRRGNEPVEHTSVCARQRIRTYRYDVVGVVERRRVYRSRDILLLRVAVLCVRYWQKRAFLDRRRARRDAVRFAGVRIRRYDHVRINGVVCAVLGGHGCAVAVYPAACARVRRCE